MSCNHCNTKFNFFHKELGCANCGLSLCHKCLKQKCRLPNKGGGGVTTSSDQQQYNVCKVCYVKLVSGPNVAAAAATQSNTTTTPSSLFAPPDTFLKRLENLNDNSGSGGIVSPPITMYKRVKRHQTGAVALRSSGLSLSDQKLLDRLERLKERGKGPPPTESELRQRLARLKGENDYVEGPSSNKASMTFFTTPDLRSDQQKADAMLEQFVSEREIELAHNPQNDIEARLATLRGQGVRPNQGTYISNLHDNHDDDDDDMKSSSSDHEDDEIDRITRKIMDEVAIDDANDDDELMTAAVAAGGGRSSSPELPWCVLCNGDARFRCLDCSNDLYCNECNVEVHRNWGERDHRVVVFRKSK